MLKDLKKNIEKHSFSNARVFVDHCWKYINTNSWKRECLVCDYMFLKYGNTKTWYM